MLTNNVFKGQVGLVTTLRVEHSAGFEMFLLSGMYAPAHLPIANHLPSNLPTP